MKKFVAILAICMFAIFGLTACGGQAADPGTFNQPSTQTSSNKNGLISTLNLAKLSENINYASISNELGLPSIESLDVWINVKQDTDSAGAAYTYKMTNIATEGSQPAFEAATYDEGGNIMEARALWASTNALSDQETFSKYSTALIIAISGVDLSTAQAMYNIASSAQYTNGTSQTLTYAYSGNIRCYYMVNGGYHMLCVEPFSNDAKTSDEKTGKFVYTQATAAGATSTAGAQTSADQTATDNSGNVQVKGGTQ